MNSYEDFRIMHSNHLASVLSRADEKSSKDLCERIDERIDHYANGDLDHAVDAVTLLWKLSMAGGPLPPSPEFEGEPDSPLSSHSPSSPRIDVPSLANCKLVESALIKSLRTGRFFDRRYWTRHPKTAKTLRPIYISSIVAGDKLRRINDRE